MAFKLVIKRRGDVPEVAASLERTFDEPIVTIGSDPAATLHLDADGVAPEHVVIILEDRTPLLINRYAGTLMNGEPLAREARRPLAHGDRLDIADFQITAHLNGAFGSTAITSGTAAPLPRADMPGNETETDASAPTAQLDASALSAPSAALTRTPATPDTNDTPKSFAAILNSLRTEEDSFYFVVEGGAHAGTRLLIETSEMLCGWDESGERISCEAPHVAAGRMIVRKDWTGVIVHPQGAGAISVNDEPTIDNRRLRNGDRVTFALVAGTRARAPLSLVFHEPASLVVLDSLLPQKLPPPVAPVAPPVTDNAVNEALTVAPAPVALKERKPRIDFDRKYFGYFTFLELMIMTLSTLVAAVIIFLVLQYL